MADGHSIGCLKSLRQVEEREKIEMLGMAGWPEWSREVTVSADGLPVPSPRVADIFSFTAAEGGD